MDRQKVTRSAKWGAACAPCMTAKTRCVRSESSGAKCDRCQSLEKTCLDQLRRPRKKRQAKPSKISQLEERIDDLLGALHASEQGASPAITGSSPDGKQDHSARNYPSSSVSIEIDTPDGPSHERTALNAPTFGSNASAFPVCTCRAPVSKEDLVPFESDETLLSIFMNQLSTRFPFVIIPPGTTTEQLQATRPLLLKVIRMVASVRHLRSMRGQYRAIIQHISEAMLVRSERSLDLLQSILVVLGFYHYHCMTHAQFNNLTHLAVSLIGDMDLNTPPTPQEKRNQLPLIRAKGPSSRTNEERRALVGVWYMSSNITLIAKQFEPVRYTKYLNQCLQELEDAAEYGTDKLAVQLVRIQHVTEKIFYFHSRDQTVGILDTPEFSIAGRIEEFQIELDTLRNSLPPQLRSDYVLSCHYNSAYLRLFDPLLAGANLPDYESHSFASLSHSLPGLSIFNVFSRFSAALKTWFNEWLSIPVCSYFYLPQPISVQVIHAAMMLARWVRVAGPGAVMLSRIGTATVRTELDAARQPVMAFSGVPECPDLGFQQPPLASTPSVSSQVLNQLRAQVLAQTPLHVDIFGILDSMVIRFKAAKEEMAAAQGGVWKNNTWDIAAEHIEMKKTRVETWCETIATVVGDRRNRPADICDIAEDGNRESVNTLGRHTIDSLEWLVSKGEEGNEQWESDLFDELMRDIHTTDIIDMPNVWSAGILDDMGLMGGSYLHKDWHN